MPRGKDHVLLLRNLRSSKGTCFGNAKRRAARLQIKHGRYFQCREQGLERAAYTVQALPEFRAESPCLACPGRCQGSRPPWQWSLHSSKPERAAVGHVSEHGAFGVREGPGLQGRPSPTDSPPPHQHQARLSHLLPSQKPPGRSRASGIHTAGPSLPENAFIFSQEKQNEEKEIGSLLGKYPSEQLYQL